MTAAVKKNEERNVETAAWIISYCHHGDKRLSVNKLMGRQSDRMLATAHERARQSVEREQDVESFSMAWAEEAFELPFDVADDDAA